MANYRKTKPCVLTVIQVLSVLACMASSANAGILPPSKIQELCFKAKLIVSGTHMGNGKVIIDTIYHASIPSNRTLSIIQVPSIPGHVKIINKGFVVDKETSPIRTNRVVLFLKEQPAGVFEPIHLFGAGSRGLFWYDDHTCYGYKQIMNPGPYVLIAGSSKQFSPESVPTNFEDMREQIESGLKHRARWESVKATEDPAERARLMASYLMPGKRPEGFDFESISMRKELRSNGTAAIPALIEVLDSYENAFSYDAVLALFDIGCMHPGSLDPAVPSLCRLLDVKEPYSPYYVLSTLTAAADPRAIPHVRPLLEHESEQVRAQAASALAAMNDVESFDKIVALIEALPDLTEKTRYVHNNKIELTNALFKLDPDRARPVIEQLETRYGYAGVHHHIKGYDRVKGPMFENVLQD